jgi:hypothetical protein
MPMTFQTRLLRAADAITDGLGLLQGPFDPQGLIAAACRRAGVAQFPAPEMLEPLHRYLAALDEETGLSALGRASTLYDVRRLLQNVLRFHHEEKRDPTILRADIDRPVFVLGVPRAGTSFLHNLLAQDPRVMAPRCWQMVNPWPIDPAGRPDRRIAIAQRGLDSFAWLAPEFRDLHPLDATSTQECTEITAHCFRSLRFDTLHTIPAYRAWLDSVGHDLAYEFHKRFLQHLQAQERDSSSRRWMLKCPDHVFAISAIRRVYPDAHLVFVHRDPLKVLASVAKLTEVLRRPFARMVDNAAIGCQVSTHWRIGVDAMIAHSMGGPNETHIQYKPLVADPLGTVRHLYDRIGLELSDQALANMRAHLAAKPNGGYGKHIYRFEDHALDPAALAEQFRPYMRHFDIEPETDWTAASS